MQTATSKPTLEVVVGLGSNLPWRELSSRMLLIQAVLQLQKRSCRPEAIRVSSLYQSAPIGPQQPDFFNAAVKLFYWGTAEALLDELQAVESNFGRERVLHWGPRTLDLDILHIVGMSIQSERLQVPHPELLRRCFAYGPLLEVLKEPIDAQTGLILSPEYAAVEADQMCKIDSESWWKTLPHK